VTASPVEVLCAGDVIPAGPFAGSPASAGVWRAFAGADHVFANLEVALTEQTSPADKLVCLRAAPELAAEFVAANIDVVTLANNHTMDFGTEGMRETRRAIGAIGLPGVGAGENVAEALTPVILGSAPVRTAFLGLSATLPAGAAAAANRGGVAPLRVRTDYVLDPVIAAEEPAMAPFVHTVVSEADLERACAAVAAAKRGAELVVVALHWGVSTGLVPAVQGWLATYQQPVAHRLIDAGADAIIGHHPHVLQGVESYRGRPIFYSLGNLLFHRIGHLIGDSEGYPPYDWSPLSSPETRLGGVARLVREPGGELRAAIRFVVLDEAGEPRWAERENAERAAGRVLECSSVFGTSFQQTRDGFLLVDLRTEGATPGSTRSPQADGASA
jgi:poly-gamma-glutamate synthesis protein (capsule biosynthesis protein)